MIVDVDHADVLLDGFDRIASLVPAVLADLPPDALTFRVDSAANTIAWLLWHASRVQDDHVATVAGSEQIWTAAGWSSRFDLPFPAGDIGFAHTSEDVSAVAPPADLLLGYHAAVHERTVDFVRTLGADDLDRVVDRQWDPPVTLGVRLVSVLSDDLQHLGQAAYVRGIWQRQHS